MKDIHFKFLAAAVMLLALAPHSSWASGKKGIGLYDGAVSHRIAELNVAWYYTWKTDPLPGASAEKFVPMLWGGNRLAKDAQVLKGRGTLPVMLAINEPDRSEQSHMSVDEVIAQWPQIQAMAKQVSSPAPAGSDNPWIQAFLTQAREKGLRVDFMAIHVYGPPNVQAFLARVDKAHAKYQLPIWITEMGVADWASKGKPGTNRYAEQQVLEFMKALLPELEKRPYVVRYAWFGAGVKAAVGEPGRTSALFGTDGKITPLGRFYADFQ